MSARTIRSTLLLILAGALAGQTATASSGSAPNALTPPEWAAIQQLLPQQGYAIHPARQGLRAANAAHGWNVAFHPQGRTRLQGADHHITLQLDALGRDRLEPLGHPQGLTRKGNTATYRWNSNLRETWTNGPEGLEQWFFLQQPPQPQTGQPLRLQLALGGNLKPHLQDNTLRLTNHRGRQVLFHKLKVWDSAGQTLPAHMHMQGTHLQLVIDDRQARYPLTIDPLFTQNHYLKPDLTAYSHPLKSLGSAVALDGDTLAVGAPAERSNSTGVNGNELNSDASYAGAVYVFTRDANGVWSQQAYIKASNTGVADGFGSSVTLSGDTLVVGAPTESSAASGINGDQNDNTAAYAGAAYVFVRDANGGWSQQAYIKAANAGAGDRFGTSVALSGDTLVVGANGEDSANTTDPNDNTATDAGAAYVFTRDSNGVWSQQAYIKAANAETGDAFGISIALSGDTLVLGATSEDSAVNGNPNDNTASAAGAAYVFTRDSNGVWTQQAYIKAANAEANDAFGNSVALSGDTLVVGAKYEDGGASLVNGNPNDNTHQNAGAAYVFTRDINGVWSQQAYIKAANNWRYNAFGHSVAISGNRIATGAPGETKLSTGVNGEMTGGSNYNVGAAYVFEQSANTWGQQAYVKPSSNGEPILNFGNSMAMENDLLAIGVPREHGGARGIDGTPDNGMANSGAVYLYERNTSGNWEKRAYIKASNTDVDDYFGWAVALSGNTLAVGAYREDSAATGVNGLQDDNSLYDSGAVYVFTRDNNGSWSQQAYIKASNPGIADQFGVSIVLHGDTLVVSAPGEDSAASGINGLQDDNSLNDSGAVYVFTRDNNGSWSQQAYIKASNADAWDRFGTSIALHGDTLAVGAYREDSAATGVNGLQGDNSLYDSGAVYVFTRDNNGSWSQQAYIKASNTGENDRFGFQFALYGDTLAIGADNEDSNSTGINGAASDDSATGSGAVYIFNRDNGSWSQQAYIKASNTDSSDRFGGSLALWNDSLIVGAPNESSDTNTINGPQNNNNASRSGAAYLFTRDATGAWSQKAYLKASNTDSDDQFGTAVAISATHIAAGAVREASASTGIDGIQTDNSIPYTGAAYLFTWNVEPTVGNLQLLGDPYVGSTLTAGYQYQDANNDPEGTSTFQWYRDGQPIAGATGSSYTPTAADMGAAIAFQVTPRAATGASPGTAGMSPSVTIINAPPVASNVTISGDAVVGGTLTGSYTYADVDGDPEGNSLFQWYSNGQPITGATGTSYTAVQADSGANISFEVTPVASSGNSPGQPVISTAVTIQNSPPVASNVAISGNTIVGGTLTGSYTYADADGDPEGSSLFQWYSNGQPITGANGTSYTVVQADSGANISFEVTPVASSGNSPGQPVISTAVTIQNSPPVANNLTISGDAIVGGTLTGSYTYADVDGDPEGNSLFQWYSNGQPIAGATGTSYTTVQADSGANISFEVTPIALTGSTTGASVTAAAVTVAINNAPVALEPYRYVLARTGELFSQPLNAWVMDPDGDTLTFLAGGNLPGWLAVDVVGTLSGQPQASDSNRRPVPVDILVSDGFLGTSLWLRLRVIDNQEVIFTDRYEP